MSENKQFVEVLSIEKGVVQKYSLPKSKYESYLTKGITVVFPSTALNTLSTPSGTRFFLSDGTEITDVTSFSIKETGADDLMSITLTLPLFKVAYSETN